MAELILGFSKTYLETEIANAFVENADCSNVYAQAIPSGTMTYYVSNLNLFKTTIKSGKTVQATLEQGQAPVSIQEVLVDLGMIASLVDRNTLLTGGTTLLPLPLIITIKLEAKPSADKSAVELKASFDSVYPSSLLGVDLKQAFKTKVKPISITLPVGSLSKFPLSVRSASLKLFSDSNLALRVTIQDTTAASTAYLDWVTFRTSYTTAKYLASGEDWAVMQCLGLMAYLANEEFKKYLPQMQSKGFNPDGEPTVSWLPNEQKLRIYGEGEVEVDVCPDINVWYQADTTFKLNPAPTLETTICTDAGLTGTGKAEAVLCGVLAVVTGAVIGGVTLGPIGALIAGIATTITSIVLGVQFTSQATSQVQKCQTTKTVLSFNGLTAQRLSYHAHGLVIGGKSGKTFLGNPQMKTDDLTIDGHEWVLPECAGNYDYAPWLVENTGQVPLQICMFEAIPAFDVGFGGYNYHSGEYAGIELQPGEKDYVKVKGSGQLIIYTNAGIRSIKIDPANKIIAVTVVGVEGGMLKFGASLVPFAWLCSGLKNVKKYVKIPIRKKIPDHDIDQLYLPVLPKARSFAVYDALVTNAPAGMRLAGLVQTGEETEIAAYAGEGTIRHLNLRSPAEGDLWLGIEPGEVAAAEIEPGLRLARFTLTQAAEARLEGTVQAFELLGSRLYLADSGSLWAADLFRLQPEDSLVALSPVHLLALEQTGDSACLAGSGHLLYLARPGELLVLDLSAGAAQVVARFPLDSAPNQMVLRRGKAYLLAREGVHVLDVSNPAEIRRLATLPIEQANGIRFSGRFAYISNPQGFQVVDLGESPGRLLRYLDTQPVVAGMSIQGRSLYLHTEKGNSLIFNCYEPAEPHLAGDYKSVHWTQGMTFKADFACRLVKIAVEVYRVTQDVTSLAAIEDFRA